MPFSLDQGTLSLNTLKGDSLTTSYSGGALVGTHHQTAALDLVLTGGTGSFTNASGTVRGVGAGAFTGEGAFSLAIEGSVTTPEGSMRVRINLKGTATVSCDGGRIRITQAADGTASGAGRVTAVLSHLVGNTGCS